MSIDSTPLLVGGNAHVDPGSSLPREVLGKAYVLDEASLEGEEGMKIVNIECYAPNSAKTFLFYVFVVLTGGIFALICKWYPKMAVRLCSSKCLPSQATALIIDGEFDTFQICPVFRVSHGARPTEASITLSDNGADHDNKRSHGDSVLSKSSSESVHSGEAEFSVPFFDELREVLIFDYRHVRYRWDDSIKMFSRLHFSTEYTYGEVHKKMGKGISTDRVVQQRRREFGPCQMDIPMKSTLGLLVDEVLHPFYIFQIFSMALWFWDGYVAYATAILIISLVSVFTSLMDTRANLSNLKSMAKYSCLVNVFRGHQTLSWEERKVRVSSDHLVPGDVVELEDGMILPCDLALLSGSCIVNESMLTGESIPVLKTALPDVEGKDMYNVDESKKYTLYNGTKIIQTRYYGGSRILGLVCRTGFSTVKGRLIRSMLFPKPNKFKFYEDSYKFIGILALIAMLGFTWSLRTFIHDGMDVSMMVDRSLDLITVTVPPALPAAMTVGTAFALSRMKKKNIFCISPPRVNVCGKINLMCFDKTGTLTEDGLDVLGVRPVLLNDNGGNGSNPMNKHPSFYSSMLSTSSTQSFSQIEPDSGVELSPLSASPSQQPPLPAPSFGPLHPQASTVEGPMLHVLASCHSITRVHGELIGDPLDLKMFESTGWVLEEPEQGAQFDAIVPTIVRPRDTQPATQVLDFEHIRESFTKGPEAIPLELGIIRQFDFSSKLQRMSVLVKDLKSGKLHIHCKGSPEVIRELCRPESIPVDLHAVLASYTRHGYRVLACATREAKELTWLKAQKVSRERVERKLTFLGLIIMQNKLKPETADIIAQLRAAHIRTVMATGDNALTALSVARECHIVNPNQPIFLGDLETSSADGSARIVWTDTEDLTSHLDPVTLNPTSSASMVSHNGSILHSFAEGTGPSSMGSAGAGALGGGGGGANNPSSFVLPYAPPAPVISGTAADSERNGGNNGSTIISIPEDHATEDTALLQGESTNGFIDDSDPPWLWMAQEGHPFSIAVTGKAFAHIAKKHSAEAPSRIFREVLLRAQIFARMSPEHKTQLIESLQNEKYTVGMCGDGANDCGALKTADVGVSLSEAEASIAAPFTSRTPSIACVVKILREGRAALVTSFQCFKYMALYSMIQFVSVTILYSISSNLSDFQYLWIDLFSILPLAVLMSRTGAYKTLVPQQPTGSLMSITVIASVLGQVLIALATQIIAYQVLKSQDWFEPLTEKGSVACYENTVIFLFSNVQYIAVVLAFSISKPFRKPISSNILFAVAVTVLLVLSYLIILFPTVPVLDWFEGILGIEYLPTHFRIILAAISLGNFGFCYLYEKIIVVWLVEKLKAAVRRRKVKTASNELVPVSAIEELHRHQQSF